MTLAVILAGGRGERLGGCDKPLLSLGKNRILDQLVLRLSPQVSQIALAIRQEQDSFRGCGMELLPDSRSGKGPLVGILSAIEWASRKGVSSVLTVPGDTPFIPYDLVTRLSPAPSCAESLGRMHPLVAFWPTACLPELHQHINLALASGLRRQMAVRPFSEKIGMRQVSFDSDAGDPFLISIHMKTWLL